MNAKAFTGWNCCMHRSCLWLPQERGGGKRVGVFLPFFLRGYTMFQSRLLLAGNFYQGRQISQGENSFQSIYCCCCIHCSPKNHSTQCIPTAVSQSVVALKNQTLACLTSPSPRPVLPADKSQREKKFRCVWEKGGGGSNRNKSLNLLLVPVL